MASPVAVGRHRYEYDVAIVGGGPSGAAATGTLTLLGKKVVVIDPAGALTPMPTGTVSKVWRACGETFGAKDGSKRVEWEVVERCMEEAQARVAALIASMKNPKFDHVVPVMHRGEVGTHCTLHAAECSLRTAYHTLGTAFTAHCALLSAHYA